MSGFMLKKRYAYKPQPQCDITLIEACEKDDISLAKKAIREGAGNIRSCIIIAIEKDHVELAKYLLELYADCGLSDIKTIMYHACLHGHDSIVSDILEYISTKIRIMSIFDTNIDSSSMNTEVYNKGLYGACEGNNVELIERMITLGANDIVQGFFKACLGDSLDSVKYLINRCLIDINYLDNYILQGILFSCVHNHINVGRYLLDLIHNDDGILGVLSSLIYDITIDNITKKLVISRSGFYPTIDIESFTDLNRYMLYLVKDLKFKHSNWFLSRVLSNDLFNTILKY
jgi:hypothetical protein